MSRNPQAWVVHPAAHYAEMERAHESEREKREKKKTGAPVVGFRAGRKSMRPRLTCISLGHKEENDAPLGGEVRNLDVLILFVLERHSRQDVPNIDGRQRLWHVLLLGFRSFGIRPGLFDGIIRYYLME